MPRDFYRGGGRSSYSRRRGGFSDQGLGQSRRQYSPRHPWIRQDPHTHVIHFTPPGRKPGYKIHPYQMMDYLSFNKNVCRKGGRTSKPVPYGLEQFAELFNSVSSRQYKYRFATFDVETKKWKVPQHRVKASHIHTDFVDRKRYQSLITMGILTEQGFVDTHNFELTMSAIRQPHQDNNTRNHYFQRRRARQYHQEGSDDESSDSETQSSDSESNTDEEPPHKASSRRRSLSPKLPRRRSHSPPAAKECPALRAPVPLVPVPSVPSIELNARGSPVIREADGTLIDNHYAPESPYLPSASVPGPSTGTADVVPVANGSTGEDVLMGNLEALGDFFDLDRA